MELAGFLHGDFKISAVRRGRIMDLELSTWKDRPLSERRKILHADEIRYRFHEYVWP